MLTEAKVGTKIGRQRNHCIQGIGAETVENEGRTSIPITIGGDSLLKYKIKVIGRQNAALTTALLLGVEPHQHLNLAEMWAAYTSNLQLRESTLSFDSILKISYTLFFVLGIVTIMHSFFS